MTPARGLRLPHDLGVHGVERGARRLTLGGRGLVARDDEAVPGGRDAAQDLGHPREDLDLAHRERAVRTRLGRARHRAVEHAVAIEDDQGLEAIHVSSSSRPSGEPIS